MATNLKPVDVAVIGLGAAGGVAVLPLARAGLKIAALEAGSWIPPSEFRADEIHNNVRRRVTTGTKVFDEVPTFRTGPNQPTRRNTVPPMMNAVGGTSHHYDGNSWRFHPWDFRVRSGGLTERAIFVVDKQGIIRYIDVHDIGTQPPTDKIIEALDKLR